jgi:hypothetical protein
VIFQPVVHDGMPHNCEFVVDQAVRLDHRLLQQVYLSLYHLFVIRLDFAAVQFGKLGLNTLRIK